MHFQGSLCETNHSCEEKEKNMKLIYKLTKCSVSVISIYIFVLSANCETSNSLKNSEATKPPTAFLVLCANCKQTMFTSTKKDKMELHDKG